MQIVHNLSQLTTAGEELDDLDHDLLSIYNILEVRITNYYYLGGANPFDRRIARREQWAVHPVSPRNCRETYCYSRGNRPRA